MWRKKPHSERRANCARRSSRLHLPRPRSATPPKKMEGVLILLTGSTNAGSDSIHGLASYDAIDTAKPSPGSRPGRASDRFLRSQPRRIGLGRSRQARSRRDQNQLIMRGPFGHAQPELSTLLETGTFYFALTVSRQEARQKLGFAHVDRDRCL